MNKALSFKIFKFSLVFIMIITIGLFMRSFNFAADSENTENQNQISTSQTHSIGDGICYMAAAFAIAAGSISAGLAVSSAAPAALGAFSENPSGFGKTIVFVAFGEGITVFSLIIAVMIINGLTK